MTVSIISEWKLYKTYIHDPFSTSIMIALTSSCSNLLIKAFLRKTMKSNLRNTFFSRSLKL